MNGCVTPLPRYSDPASLLGIAGRNLLVMKIVHILPALTKGGGERVAVDLANHAATQGHEVTLLAAVEVDPTLLRDALRPDVEVRYIAGAGDQSRLEKYLALAPWLKRNWHWLVQHDIVHCHLSFGAFLGSIVETARRFSGGRGPAVVETYHAVGMPIPAFDRWLHSRMALRRDGLALMAEDPFWNAIAARRGARPTALIENGINVDPVRPGPAETAAFRASLGAEPDALIVGTVGRLAAARQPWRFVEVFARIAQARDDVIFYLGGDGPERERVAGAVRSYGLENRIHMPGLVTDPRLPCSAMDLYVTLNASGVTGIAALEAVAIGLPVVAIQLVESYDGADDWIFSSPDHEAVARKALGLLENQAARHALATGQHARLQARNSVDSMARAYYGLYRETLLSRSARIGRPAGNSE